MGDGSLLGDLHCISAGVVPGLSEYRSAIGFKILRRRKFGLADRTVAPNGDRVSASDPTSLDCLSRQEYSCENIWPRGGGCSHLGARTAQGVVLSHRPN